MSSEIRRITSTPRGEPYDNDFAGHPYTPASSGGAMRGRCVWQSSRTGMQCGGPPDHDWHLMFGRERAAWAMCDDCGHRGHTGGACPTIRKLPDGSWVPCLCSKPTPSFLLGSDTRKPTGDDDE